MILQQSRFPADQGNYGGGLCWMNRCGYKLMKVNKQAEKEKEVDSLYLTFFLMFV